MFIHNENTKVKCCSVPRFSLQSRFIGGKSHKEKDSQKKLWNANFEGDTTETDFLIPSNADSYANLGDVFSLPNKKKESDCYISKLLCTAERDFLVRNNGDRVKIECLRRKIVLLFIIAPEDEEWGWDDVYRDVLEVYDELSPKHVFEVVFVAQADDGIDEEEFDKLFSKMPWLAIPFWDFKTRDSLAKRFYKFRVSRSVIFNANGMLLQKYSTDELFRYWGPDCYPFTMERTHELENEEREVTKNMSLKNLLAASSDDFVISNKGTKVPISELEGKVVGLYIFGSCQAHNIMKNLVKIYEELKDKGENFEIVFVNDRFNEAGYSDEEIFKQKLKEMPWLALPFMHKSCRKLPNIFVSEMFGGVNELDNVLVIIGPYGEYVEIDGATIIEDYGVAAYPFTKEKVAQVRREMDAGSFLWESCGSS